MPAGVEYLTFDILHAKSEQKGIDNQFCSTKRSTMLQNDINNKCW